MDMQTPGAVPDLESIERLIGLLSKDPFPLLDQIFVGTRGQEHDSRDVAVPHEIATQCSSPSPARGNATPSVRGSGIDIRPCWMATGKCFCKLYHYRCVTNVAPQVVAALGAVPAPCRPDCDFNFRHAESVI